MTNRSPENKIDNTQLNVQADDTKEVEMHEKPKRKIKQKHRKNNSDQYLPNKINIALSDSNNSHNIE